MTLGERIRVILIEQKIKQVDFAKTLGISPNYVNLLVNGKKTTVSTMLAKLIEENYGYSAKWVLTGEGDKLPVNGMTADKAEVIRKIKKMSDSDVKAVLAFVNTLDSINHRQDQL